MSPFDFEKELIAYKKEIEYLGRLPAKGYERKESTPYILILVASVIINIISSILISQG